jgi:hypothetical protein
MSYIVDWSNDGGRSQDYISKVEVDYGEGAGWEDVTHAALFVWDHTQADDQLRGFHTYESPGTYDFQARVTYTEGEQVIGLQSPRFIVTE